MFILVPQHAYIQYFRYNYTPTDISTHYSGEQVDRSLVTVEAQQLSGLCPHETKVGDLTPWHQHPVGPA